MFNRFKSMLSLPVRRKEKREQATDAVAALYLLGLKAKVSRAIR
jgi:hypothetical protein